MTAQDQDENIIDPVDLAQEYCEGYSHGFYEGHSADNDDDLLAAVTNVAAVESKAYRLGLGEGFASGRRAALVERDKRAEYEESVRWEVDALESDYVSKGKRFTEQQRERWRILQKQIAERGDKSWQQILLDLYRHLADFEGAARLTTDEESVLSLLRKAVLIRLSRTKLVKDISS